MVRIIELFAGIGACSSALDRLGIEHEIVDAVEIDKYAIASFNAIHGTKFEVQDICKWDKEVGDIDLIMHGSPCQDFSVAGKQAGGDEGSGTRSSLMYETLRIVRKVRPKYVIWENVKNLVSKKHKHNFDRYIEEMEKIGYRSYWKVLNAKDYGVPQNRERVFTVSIRNDANGDFEFPKEQELKVRLKDVLEENVEDKYYLSDVQVNRIESSNYMTNKRRIQEKEWCDTLCARDWKDPKCVPVEAMRIGGIFDEGENKHQAGSIWDKEGLSPTLDTMQGGWRQPCVVEEPKVEQVGDLGKKYEQSGRVYSSEGISPTVMGNSHIGGYTPIKVAEPKIITHNIKQQVSVRKYEVDIEGLKKELRSKKEERGITNKEIADRLSIPLTQVEHYFRTDSSFTIPDKDIWLKLKEILGISTNEFDASIMEFEEREGVYEKGNRVYDEEGIMATLTQQEEKIMVQEPKVINPLKGKTDYSWQFEQQVYDAEGIARSVKAGEGSGNIPKVVVVGNYMPSGYDASRVVDSEGIAPTVKENHGTVTGVVLPGAYGREYGSKGKMQDTEGTCDTLQAAMGGGGGNVPIVVDSSVKPSVAKNFEREKEEIMNSDKEIYQCECESGYQDNKVGLKVSPTIRANNNDTFGLDSEYRIRKLTPKECWRLMGFTDAEFEKAAKVNSNTQLYKQAGNSIVVNVLEGILKNLFTKEGEE